MVPAFCLPPVTAVPTTAEMGCLPLVPGSCPVAASVMAEAVEATKPLGTIWFVASPTALAAPSTTVFVTSRSILSDDMVGDGQIDIYVGFRMTVMHKQKNWLVSVCLHASTGGLRRANGHRMMVAPVQLPVFTVATALIAARLRIATRSKTYVRKNVEMDVADESAATLSTKKVGSRWITSGVRVMMAGCRCR